MVTKSRKAKSPSKKSTSKSSKSTSGSGPEPRGDDGYIRLRTMIDSLECGSIRYYLQGANPVEKRARLKKLETDLMPIVDWLWHQTGAVKQSARMATFAADDVVCPDGYTNCHGCCVPYPCPDKQG
jgi:hypothetical protein